MGLPGGKIGVQNYSSTPERTPGALGRDLDPPGGPPGAKCALSSPRILNFFFDIQFFQRVLRTIRADLTPNFFKECFARHCGRNALQLLNLRNLPCPKSGHHLEACAVRQTQLICVTAYILLCVYFCYSVNFP